MHSFSVYVQNMGCQITRALMKSVVLLPMILLVLMLSHISLLGVNNNLYFGCYNLATLYAGRLLEATVVCGKEECVAMKCDQLF